VFAEVTQEVHEADASTARLVGERRIVKLHSGSGDWLVHVSSTVRLKNFMPALPDVVAALPQGERTHWRNGWVAFKGRASPDQARVMFVPHDDMIFANAPDGDLGEHLADIVSELARRPDNASKLGGGNSALVVHTHQSKTARAVQHVLDGGGAPNVRLPPACDHAIVLAGMIPAGFVSFSRGTGWRGHTFLQVSLPALEQTIRARWRLTRVIARRTAVWRRLLGVPEALASECGSLCHGDGAQGRAPHPRGR
jgi:hypothetical protein